MCPARIEISERSGIFFVSYQSVHVCERDKRKEKGYVHCPICESQLDKHVRHWELSEHLRAVHGVHLETENLTFGCFAGEFFFNEGTF